MPRAWGSFQSLAAKRITTFLKLPSRIPSITSAPSPAETPAPSCLAESRTGPRHAHSASPDPKRGSSMSSQAQINANRLNSQKSTGPASPEGKAASSLNALKSGIHAVSHIIPGEDPAALEALTAAFLLEFQPTGPNQLALVDTLIAAEWTQRRLRRIEAELWNSRDESLDPTHAEISDYPPNPTSPFPALGHSYPDAIDPFLRIERRIDATNRLYLRTLLNLQKAPVAQASACHVGNPADTSPQPPSPHATQPLTPQIGFVPPIAFTPMQPPRATHENQQQPDS